MHDDINQYLSKIGRKGGLKSRRVLLSEDARLMVKVREARKLYKRYYSQCFWSCKPDLKITAELIPWVARQLKKYGGMKEFKLARKLCQ